MEEGVLGIFYFAEGCFFLWSKPMLHYIFWSSREIVISL